MSWEDRLARYIEERRNVPFEWGHNDCVKFAFRGMLVTHGVNILQSIENWLNKEQAIQVIKSMGPDIRTISETLLPKHGFIKRDIKMAKRGSMIITDGPEGPMFCICIGSKMVAPGKDGLVFLPLDGICWEYKGDK